MFLESLSLRSYESSRISRLCVSWSFIGHRKRLRIGSDSCGMGKKRPETTQQLRHCRRRRYRRLFDATIDPGTVHSSPRGTVLGHSGSDFIGPSRSHRQDLLSSSIHLYRYGESVT
ncbi:unnamed protein product [Timema podura]|uniref:Uncharacterized protein n=1 Tax=Timema podura TaxID=61482 RepID=A0ABN7PMU2_TIMPD|nr:unnamed protein product [Timema podura]